MLNLKNWFRKLDLTLVLGIALFVYVTLRAVFVPITDDEYISLHFHVSENWWAILTTGLPNQGWAGNNHILNSLFMKMEMHLFGQRDWALRLHSLATFAVCYGFVREIIKEVTPSVSRQFYYLILIFLNPYLLEFFGLARGYGLSMAAWSAAFYFFIKYTQGQKAPDLWRVLWALFLAIWSNFSAIYLAFLLGLLFLIEFYQHRRSGFIRKHFVYLTVGSLFIGIVNSVPFYRSFKNSDIYGGNTGLFQDVVVTSIERFVRSNQQIDRFRFLVSNWTILDVAALTLLILWLALQVLNFAYKTNRPILQKISNVALFQTIGIALLAKLLFVLFKAPYPMGRTTLLFSLPFLLSSAVAFENIQSRFRRANFVFIALIPFLIWHFYQCFSLEDSREWWQAGDAKKVLSFLKNDLKIGEQGKKLSLGAEGYQYHPLAFYNEAQHSEDILTIKFSDMKTDQNDDFFLAPSFRTGEVWSTYKPIKTFKHSVLFQKK